MGRGVLLAGVALIALGAAAAGYGVTHKPGGGMSPEASAAMGSAVASLDGEIKAARAAIEQRGASRRRLIRVSPYQETSSFTGCYAICKSGGMGRSFATTSG